MTKKKEKTYFDMALDVAYKQKWKISILVDNPLPKHLGEGRESYVGKIRGIGEDCIALDLENRQRIRMLVIKKSLILSMWVYNET